MVTRLLFAFVALLLMPIVAHAGVDKGMQKVFASQANVTQPAYVDGQYRGVISGGSVQVRNRIMNAQLVSFDPPKITAGCGGIDIRGGSMSWISTEEFTALARSVASNAVGYAFQVALSSICQTCMSQIETLRAQMDKLSLAQLNSCQLAQKLVDGSGFTAAMADRQASQARAESGSVSDQLAGSNQGPGQNSPTSDLSQEAPEKAKLIVKNYVWEGLKNQNVGAWFDSSDSTELREHLMSMIGTVVVCTSGEGNCHATDVIDRKGDPVVRYEAPTLRLAQVVLGSDGNAGTVHVLKCGDTDRCLDVKNVQASSFKGMRAMVLDALLGPEGQRDTGGMIGVYVHGSNQAFTATQQALRRTHGDFVEEALRLARYEGGEAVARKYVDSFADLIASEIAYQQMMQMLDAMEAAITHSGGDPEGKVQGDLVRAREQLQADFNTVLQQASGRQNLMASFRAVESDMSSRTSAAPTGTRVTQ